MNNIFKGVLISSYVCFDKKIKIDKIVGVRVIKNTFFFLNIQILYYSHRIYNNL